MRALTSSPYIKIRNKTRWIFIGMQNVGLHVYLYKPHMAFLTDTSQPLEWLHCFLCNSFRPDSTECMKRQIQYRCHFMQKPIWRQKPIRTFDTLKIWFSCNFLFSHLKAVDRKYAWFYIQQTISLSVFYCELPIGPWQTYWPLVSVSVGVYKGCDKDRSRRSGLWFQHHRTFCNRVADYLLCRAVEVFKNDAGVL